MLITKKKRKVRLGNCPIGLFLFGDTICLKTEYWSNGKPECFIVSSGEFFCGGVTDNDEYFDLFVIPLNIDFKFFDKVEKAIEIIEKLEIDEISKQGGISALKLVLNER
jgi:hypothetical protein